MDPFGPLIAREKACGAGRTSVAGRLNLNSLGNALRPERSHGFVASVTASYGRRLGGRPRQAIGTDPGVVGVA